MKKIFITVLIASMVSGCDAVYKSLNKPKKGTLDAVSFCMAENSNKEGLLTKNDIKLACVKKHQQYSIGNPFSGTCFATVEIKTDGESIIKFTYKCINNTKYIITAIEGKIIIKNLNDLVIDAGMKYDEIGIGKSTNTWIKPKESFAYTTIRINKDWSNKVKENLPFCSAVVGEACKTWDVEGYYYLDPNI